MQIHKGSLHFCFIAFDFTKCSNDNSTNPTQVRINMKDESGNNVAGAYVSFYEPSQGDNIVLNTLNNFTTVIHESGVLRLDIIDTTSYSITS